MTTNTTAIAPTDGSLSTGAAHAVVRAYLDTWNATNEQDQRRLLNSHWAPTAAYVDPLAAVRGHDELCALVSGVHDQFPGFVFSLVGDIDSHHRQIRFQWGLGPAAAEPVILGFDVVLVDQDDRILDVRGFLDRVPS